MCDEMGMKVTWQLVEVINEEGYYCVRAAGGLCPVGLKRCLCDKKLTEVKSAMDTSVNVWKRHHNGVTKDSSVALYVTATLSGIAPPRHTAQRANPSPLLPKQAFHYQPLKFNTM